jgi:phosphatidylglycerophosphatase A
MINKFENLVLTMFGIGYFKYAQGTLASLVTCIIFYLFWTKFGLKSFQIPIYFFLIFIFIYSSVLINKIYKNEDSKEIVIDEFVGQSIPIMAWYYIGNLLSKPIFNSVNSFEIWVLLSFILFRFFDIFKPFPINLIDKKIKNGFGVMLDDLIAGIFSAVSLYIIFLWT